MNNLDKQYQSLLQDILDNGVEKNTRNGKVLSVFGRTIRYKFKDGKFPLLTTKKMAWKTMVTELLWFLQGRTDLRYLLENNCHIWTGDAYKVYDKDFDAEHPPFSAPYPKRLTQKEFEEKIMTDDSFNAMYGDLGPIYGKQWRSWNKVRFRDIHRVNQHPTQIMGVENPFEEEGKWVRGYEDQIANLINELKTNPDSRRLMVNAWNVGELDQMVLPPCHYGFQVYTRELSFNERIKQIVNSLKSNAPLLMEEDEKTIEWLNNNNVPTRAISLMWNQRSVDTFLGLPFNIASYGLLLEIIAKEVNMVPDELIGNLGDVHLYSNHVEQAKEQIVRIPFELPTLKIEDEVKWKEGDCLPSYSITDFTLINYQSHPTIKAPLSN